MSWGFYATGLVSNEAVLERPTLIGFHATNSFLIRKTVPTPVFRSLAIRRTPRLAAKALLMAVTLAGLRAWRALRARGEAYARLATGSE